MAEKKSRKMIADLSAKYSPEKRSSKFTGTLTNVLKQHHESMQLNEKQLQVSDAERSQTTIYNDYEQTYKESTKYPNS